MEKDLSNLRTEYVQPEFGPESADVDPIKQFDRWFEEIRSLKIDDPNAMTLATVGKDGIPSARVVLLKGIQNGKFVFFTNYGSNKGLDIHENPNVCLNFYWPPLSRQVRINGKAERIDELESQAYFESRPRESQLGAWTSPQSSPIHNRKVLEDRYKLMEERFRNKDKIDKPKQWGGYAVLPSSIEFWQGRPSRLHDRLFYRKNSDGNWEIIRLAP